MYIHNTTFNIDAEVLPLWRQWLKNSYLKKSLTLHFIDDHAILKVHLDNPLEEIITVQLKTANKENCALFDQKYLPQFKQELFIAFGEKVLLFTTHLEEL